MDTLYVYPRSAHTWDFSLTPQPPAWDIDWPALMEAWPCLQELDQVPQDALFHAEGDVLIHTRMVAQELTKLYSWRALPAEERALLFISALLHDIGKPACTSTDEQGRIHSRGHSRLGERMVRQMLWQKYAAPFAVREYLAALVRLHALPLQFLDKFSPEQAVLAASQRVNLAHLALLAEADMRGRVCADQQHLLDTIELFREFCTELSCSAQPRQFADPYSRFIYFHRPGTDPSYAAYNDTRCEVVLLTGLPGVGKDTWIREHLPSWPVISLDGIRKELKIAPTDNQGAVIQLARQRAKELLRAQTSFAWNATNLLRMRRQELIELFVAYGARVRLIYLDAPYAEIMRRNQQREARVPDHVIHGFIQRMELPDLTEAHTVEWICN